jgi:hypothetical protein
LRLYLIDFNIGVAGDWSRESETRNTARNMADRGAELALLLGDFMKKAVQASTTGTTTT